MITLLTIGQTPRTDLLDPFESLYPGQIRMAGALDGLSREAIAASPVDGAEEMLYAVLEDGSATVGHHFIEQRLQLLIDRYEKESTAIAVLCMSDFSGLTSRVPLLFPLKALHTQSSAIKPADRTAIIVPIPEQVRTAPDKWQDIQGEKQYFAVSPKAPDCHQQLLSHLRSCRPDYVILDCYGFGTETAEALEQAWPCRCFSAQHALLKAAEPYMD